MLVAARSVIREVRGESATTVAAGSAVKKPQAQARQAAAAEESEPAAAGRRVDRQPIALARTEETSADEETAFVDGSDQESETDMRHLSKSERKRLKKLARMNRAA